LLPLVSCTTVIVGTCNSDPSFTSQTYPIKCYVVILVVLMNSTSKSLLVLTLVVTSTHALLSLFGQKRRIENVVRKYFDGVNKKDPEQIRSCFGDEAVIRDVVVSNTKRTVPAQVLVDRCMDFLTAHPDCQVNFHYGYVRVRHVGVVLEGFDTCQCLRVATSSAERLV
jgi:hypothetical protein